MLYFLYFFFTSDKKQIWNVIFQEFYLSVPGVSGWLKFISLVLFLVAQLRIPAIWYNQNKEIQIIINLLT